VVGEKGRHQRIGDTRGSLEKSADTGEEGKVGNRIVSHGIQFSTIKRNEKWIEWRIVAARPQHRALS
jgi:hypothetical protein